ncbi:MAG: S9 family peptidase [Acidobacteria bacterium]|nr:S9 family peptidase [Acidobacteriota bacterium]
MNRRILFATILLSLSAASIVVAQAPEKTPAPAAPRNLTIDDYFQIKRVQDPQISPEGKWVAYTVTSLSLKDDKSEKQVWMVPAAGGEAVPMTAKGVSSSHPRWSPDGKYLAFLSARGGGEKDDDAKSQVWTLNRNGGEAQQLTETIQGVQSFEWSPKGDRIVLVLQDPTPEELEAAEAKEKRIEKIKPKTPRPYVIDRLQFKQDYVGYLDRRRTHLYVVDLASKKLAQATSGDYDDAEPAWSPDGRFLAFASNRSNDPDHNFNTDIWVVAADNPDKGMSLLRLTTNPGHDDAPAWSPDGKWVAYVSQTDAKALDYATQHLAIVSAQGGAEKVLTAKLDRNVIRPQFSADGKSIYFLFEDDGEQSLGSIPAGGGDVTRVIAGKKSVESFALGQDGAIAALISESAIPNEVFGLHSGQLRKLTSTNDALMAQIRLGDVEYVKFKSKDGTEVAGFLFKPPAYNPEMKYPTLLRPHGGPVGQYEWSFDFTAQLFAANGYVVLQPNPRGSSGYGQKFSQAIFADWGNKDYDDVIAMVDYAVAKGIADPARLGVGGWSYGGIMTNYVITKSGDRFKAAVSGASEALYVTNYGHDHYQKLWEWELGLPWQARALWEKISPYNQVEKIVTPTLWMGGEKDWNVPIINSEQMYQAMKRLGRTTQLVVYPGEHHGIAKPSYLKDRFERYLGWFGQHIKGEAPPKPVE